MTWLTFLPLVPFFKHPFSLLNNKFLNPNNFAQGTTTFHPFIIIIIIILKGSLTDEIII
jgi:hypothetical protein